MRGSKQDVPATVDGGGVTIRETEWGDMNVALESFPAGLETAPIFVGLPDDRCQCPHWGYVVKGRMTMRFGDREEIFEAGDAFYSPPGHVPVSHEPGTEIVQFSPSEELRLTAAAIARNMEALQVG